MQQLRQIIEIPRLKMVITQKEVCLDKSETLTAEQSTFVDNVFSDIPHIKAESLPEFLKKKAGIYNQPLPCLAMFPAKNRVIFYDSKNGQITNVDTPIAVIKY